MKACIASMGPPLMLFAWLAVVLNARGAVQAGESDRARDLGIPFEGIPGRLNAITDVEGVWVGHSTLIEGQGALQVGKGPVRTGVTAILPRAGHFEPVFAAFDTLNGNGVMTGITWVEESGFLEEPILLTNTHSVGTAYEASIHWRRKAGYHDPEARFGWAALPVVAETWDGRLNDIHGHHVKPEHVFHALNEAKPGKVEEGNVGGGTGMVCHGFKGGIGTASRLLENTYTLGALVQANYGKRENLTIAGLPVGHHLEGREMEIHGRGPLDPGHSIIVIIATDAPLLPHQLKRVARRASLGIGRTGGMGANSSGDLFLAFSTARIKKPTVQGSRQLTMLANAELDAFFRATVQCVEESVLNAMVAARTMDGIHGNKVHRLPMGQVTRMLREHRRLD
ncbi:MAG: P1 family peptidase [Verrucomicrobiota bacterium]|nr:P1 family peptidase [Verrucomicrobiota bacterium]